MKILVTYKSKTGFTEKYAKLIADELNAEILKFDDVSREKLNEFDTVIYGGGFFKSTLNGLKEMKEIFKESDAENLVIFATGANPNSRIDTINHAWSKNLTDEEMKLYPHFYVQGGINYERMKIFDRLTMKMFSKIVKKNAKTQVDKEFANIIEKSCDISDKKFIEPLIDCVKNLK